MQELRLVAVSEDGTYLVLASAGRGTRFTLPVDDRLRAAVRGQFSRLGQYEIEVENPLRPKEIQARIRSGETVEAIAELAGIPIERIRWFEGPVLQEREFMAQQAQRASVRGPGDTVPGPALGDLVSERVGPHQLETGEAVWDAWKREDGNWNVKLAFLLNGAERLAHWVFEPRRRTVAPVDDEAARFSDPAAGGVSGDGGATVTPFVPRRQQAPTEPARSDGLARPGAEEHAPQRSAPADAPPAADPPAPAAPAAERGEPAHADPYEPPAFPERPAARARTAPEERALTETERAFSRTGRAAPEQERPAPEADPAPAAAGRAVPEEEAESERAEPSGPVDDVIPSESARRRAPAAEAPPREREERRQRPSMGPAVPGSGARRPAERPQEPRGRTPVTAHAADTDDQQGHTSDGPMSAAAAAGGAGQPARKKGRGRRASVPSWDEIMFGSKKSE
ncbi:septation protein SepH [Nocardiopsis baichengensis]|uniref:septation protein SepH n=1 Tax=Nocardiopsis baichengensis TaxID=280240 RepID=UPI000365079D|nr:septation protein SepH [Nocardiopsis baichengensis]